MLKNLVKYSGILGIGTLWGSVGLSLYIARINILGKRPISDLGVYPSTKYLFNIGLILTSIFLLTFLHNLSKNLKLSKVFVATFMIGQICQIIIAFTPFNSTNILRPIHVIAGFAFAITLPLSIWLFSKTPNISRRIKTVSRCFFYTELLLFTIGISWFVLASRAGALSEMLTAIAFDLWIVVLTIRLIKDKDLSS